MAGRWRLGVAGRGRLGTGGEAAAVRNPSLSVSRWRVITPSQAVSITNKGDWRMCGGGGGVWWWWWLVSWFVLQHTLTNEKFYF